MPNNILDSFQISGSVYDLKDKNSPSITELTQQEYDNLPSSAKTSNTLFLITDATPIDVSNYWTSAQTQSAITAAVSGKASQSDLLTVSGQVANKQDTLVSGTNIKTINNESILGSGNIDIQGGGASYQAGRGIDITNDTISFNLPISAGTGSNSLLMNEGSIASGAKSIAGGQGGQATAEGSIAIGQNTRVNNKAQWGVALGNQTAVGINGITNSGKYAMAVNNTNNAYGQSSFVCGNNNNANNTSEFSCGSHNSSNTGSTSADNTLFSVGNGTSNNSRHNAFEIRQNGDIYISKDGQDVKLQDQLGGGEVSSAITSGDTNAVAGGAVYDRFDEVEQVTAAALNVLNNKFGGLKLQQITQSDYDQLQTKDPNTLYIITNTVV